MGKSIIIKGVSFSENAVAESLFNIANLLNWKNKYVITGKSEELAEGFVAVGGIIKNETYIDGYGYRKASEHFKIDRTIYRYLKISMIKNTTSTALIGMAFYDKDKNGIEGHYSTNCSEGGYSVRVYEIPFNAVYFATTAYDNEMPFVCELLVDSDVVNNDKGNPI